MRVLVISITVILLFIIISAGNAQQPTATTADTMTRARQGPGFGFPLAYELLPRTEVMPLAVTPDGQWVQIEYSHMLAWVPSNTLRIPRGVTLRAVTNVPHEPPLSGENCISLIGDSVPHGEVVYIIPGHGFAILRMPPLSLILQEALNKRGLGYLEVRDRSSSAAFLSELGKNPYSETPECAALLEDRCRLTVIMPWVNDMSIPREDAAAAHIEDLAAFVERLGRHNNGNHVLVLGFYYGQPSDFAKEHAPGYFDENITAFNDALFAACEPEGALGDFSNVTCMETAPLFTDPDNTHVALGIGREALLAALYEPIPADVQPFFETYWRTHPNAEVYGDGVHLSETGKAILAQALVDEFLRLEPNL